MHPTGRRLRRRLISACAWGLPVGLIAASCTVAGGPAPRPAPETRTEPVGEAHGPADAGTPDAASEGPAVPAGIEEIGAASSMGGDRAEPADRAEPPPVPPPFDLNEEIRAQFGSLFLDPTAAVPVEVAEQVAHYVDLFAAGRARANYERWLGREGTYRDLILDELRAEGLPEELLFLAMLESGFNPTVVSRAGAVGLWQFMRTTGREAGLRIDDWVDERRDPIASTDAAIRHLKVLHRELGDWALAAAAYNAGLGRVRRAQRPGATSYFELVAAEALPAETRSYVPLIIAAGHVARNREQYGFTSVERRPPLAFDTVIVGPRTRLRAVARIAGLPADEVAALNAHLIGEATPPGRRWPVRLPAGSIPWNFPERLAMLSVEDRILPEYRETWWTVESGDSWWKIAHAHGITVKTLQARNRGIGDMLHPGMRVLVERRPIYGEDDLAEARSP